MAVGFSLTCDRFIDDHFVGKLSAMGQPTRPTQPSFPRGWVNKIMGVALSMSHSAAAAVVHAACGTCLCI